MKSPWKKAISMLLALIMALTAGIYTQIPAKAKAAVTCKSLVAEGLKAAGNSSKLKNQSGNAFDFDALSVSNRKKVKSIWYVCDNKGVYGLCVMEAKRSADAKTLLNAVKKYKKNNTSNNYYLTDYTKTEQQVLKNAVCGKKGKYVWYIAMSAKKADNTKGQTAIKKKL